MALITKPYTATSGDTDRSADYNSNFDTVYNLVNGNINTNNISPTAGIVDTQLNQIATANKVSGTSLTGLASVTSAAGIIPQDNLGVTFPVPINKGGTASATSAGAFTNIVVPRIYACAWTGLGTTTGTALSFTVTHNFALTDPTKIMITLLAATDTAGAGSRTITPAAASNVGLFPQNFATDSFVVQSGGSGTWECLDANGTTTLTGFRFVRAIVMACE